jgi:hypothetical protein
MFSALKRHLLSQKVQRENEKSSHEFESGQFFSVFSASCEVHAASPGEFCHHMEGSIIPRLTGVIYPCDGI